MVSITLSPGLRRPRLLRALAFCAALPAIGACGDSGGDEGGQAGAPAQPGTIGALCDLGCGNGLSCGHSAAFFGLCTASCNNDPSCIQLAPGTRCYGESTPECGRPCMTNAQCLPGTGCSMVFGGQMACIMAR
jgi:hypothetical protein